MTSTYKDKAKTKKQLIDELTELRHRIVELEAKKAPILQMKKALEKSETRYHDLVSKMNEGFGVIDERGYLIFVNPRLCEMIEYSEHELVGIHLFELLDEDSKHIIRGELEKRLRGESSQYEVMWTTKAGKKLPTLMSASPIFENDIYQGSYAVITDFSKAKETERELAQSRNELQRHIDHLVTLNGKIDLHGILHTLNKTALDVIGLGYNDVMSHFVYDIYSFSYDANVQNRLKDAIRRTTHGERMFYEEKIKVQGKLIDVFINLTPVLCRQGGVEYIVIEMQNITERKRMEEALTKSESNYRTMIDCANDAIVVMKDLRFVFANRKVNILGYTPEEVLELDPREILHPESYQNMMKIYLHRLAGEEVVSTYSVDMIHKDGSLIPIEISNTIVEYEGERADLVVAREISERKSTQRELEKAKEAAEAASSAKSMFLANMSHEMRTPLNGILGFADLLLEEELTEEQREGVETIKKSGDNLLVLINDILDLSKVEHSMIELETIPFNVESLILDIGELVRTNLSEKPVEINCILGDIHTNLLGDPTRLRQIITNLTSNAIKFTKEGEIIIGVSTEMESETHTTLKFFVKDTGIGIPEDKRDRIFESFKQVDRSTTRKYGGTGLGLTISKTLVQLMRGDIWIESEVGKGSTFYFTAQFEKDLTPMELFQPVNLRDLLGKKVLIVDDNETACRIVADVVKKIGMEPFVARSGAEALVYLKPLSPDNDHSTVTQTERLGSGEYVIRKETFEIAIIDINIPDISSFELASEISRISTGKTKIIALSATISPGIAVKIQEMGFAGFVAKPVRRQVLINMIRTALGIGKKSPKSILTRHRVREIISHDVNIMYAEDNPVNQKLGQKILERMGYKVDIVSDGFLAVEMVKKKGHYDIIFMDIQMPQMDGVEATREIRRFEKSLGKNQMYDEEYNIHIPIIALTANAMAGDREKYLDAGMDDYLAKPFKREDIQGILRQWVGKIEISDEFSHKRKMLIVEDEENMRKSVVRLLRREIPEIKVKTATDGIDATAKLGSFMPELILTDLMMPCMNGTEFVRYIRNTKRYNQTKIIVVTGLSDDDPNVVAVRRIGVDEIIFKPYNNKELILAVKSIL
ncbi:MAG: response regulator [Thermodesulfobacteriota bacterium]|nr:response regulator [Thermodesulfobacteriota bacterium]